MAGESTHRAGGAAAIGSVELCDRTFWTDGSGNPVKYSVGPVLEELGPRVEELVLHMDCAEKSTNFEFKIHAEISYDGHFWTDAGDLCAYQTAEAYTIAVVNTRTLLGRFMRFQVYATEVAGAAVESARVAVTLYWRYAT
ncbi:MAG: hypothetical protein ABIO70_34635 [Pseudomonadota bacterium]